MVTRFEQLRLQGEGTFRRTCSRKQKFEFRYQAEKAMTFYTRNADLLHVYRCPYCENYHIGKKKGWWKK